MRQLAVCLLALCLPPAAAAAQAWEDVQQGATWVSAFVDHGVTPRVALWFDGHWRRDGIGANPQQVLLRPGLQLTLRPGLRLGGGYAFISTSPYGDSPNPTPLREHRGWQQLSLAHGYGGTTWSHRVRWEQRWTAPVIAGVTGDDSYQQRFRYSVRAQRPLGGQQYRGLPLVGFVWDEVFIPVGHSDARDGRYQNRLGAGIGIPVSARQRVELGYMHQWNRITPRRTHEFNHTAVLSWVWAAPRQ